MQKPKSSQTNKKTLSIVLVILLVGLAICVLAYQRLIKGCLWWDCAPARSFNVLDLGLPAYLFPVNAVYEPIQSVHDELLYTIDEGSQRTDWSRGEAIYAIDRYSTVQYAIEGYEDLKKAILGPSSAKSLFGPPDLRKAINPRADDLLVWCATLDTNRKACEMILRYQEFVVFFMANISDEMTLQDFEEIAEFIDEQMANHLYPK